MAFNNPVVGGDGGELIRDSIKSRNYQAGVSGWIIARNGFAEFSNVLIRGGLVVTGDAQSANWVSQTSGWRLRSNGSAEFNGIVDVYGDINVRDAGVLDILGSNVNDYIRLLSGIGQPLIQFYVDTIPSSPADISASLSPASGTLTDNAALGMSAGPDGITLRGMNLWLRNEMAELGYSNALSYGVGDGAYLRLDNNRATPGEAGIEIGWDYLGTNVGFRVYEDVTTVFGPNGLAGYLNDGTTDTWYPKYIDGRVLASGGPTDTSSSSTTLVTVTSSNVQSTVVYQDRMYKAHVRCRVAGSVLNDRIQLVVANGTTQVGQDFLYRITGAITTFVDVEFTVYWRQPSNTTIANLNLRMARFSGTGTVTVRVEQNAYFMMIEECGSANNISGL